MNIGYYWSKLFKKLRWKSILNSEIHRSSKVESGSLFVNSKMGKHSFCGYDCQIVNTEIGAFCSISNNVVIGGGRHPMEWVSMSPVFYEGRDSVKKKFSEHARIPNQKVTIGHDVWIGEKVLISQGVNIGTGAVIGMGSVVTKDVEPYSIVAGSPAKFIRNRFSNELIQNLLDSEWWNLPEDRLSLLAKHIENPLVFLERLKE